MSGGPHSKKGQAGIRNDKMNKNIRPVFDEDGKPYPLGGALKFQEITVKNIAIWEAVGFRVERGHAEHNEGTPYEYFNYKKQPYIFLKIKPFSSSKQLQHFYILDRKVAWDLIRSFDSEINYLHFLEMLEYFSLHKILEDFFYDYADETIGIYYQKTRSRFRYDKLEKVIVGIEHRTQQGLEDLGFSDLEKYITPKFPSVTESFIRVGNSKPKTDRKNHSKRRKWAYLRFIADTRILEFRVCLGDPLGAHAQKGNTQMRLYMETFDGMVQVAPPTHWKKQLPYLEAEKLYPRIRSALRLLDKTYTPITTGKVPIVGKGRMSDKEFDELQYAWFVNSFIESEEKEKN